MVFNKMEIYLILLFIIFNISSGENITCISGCNCDKNDKIINCHGLNLKKLNLPKNPIENFTILRATNNDLEYLPSEDLLKLKFPQLEGVDVEGNHNFDCQSLRHYKNLTIFSDCNEFGVIVPKYIETSTKIISTTENYCDLKCKINAKAKALADYAKYYWEKLLEKLKRFDRENKTWNEMKGFFKNIHDGLKTIF